MSKRSKRARRERRQQKRLDHKYKALKDCLDFDSIFSYEELESSASICSHGVLWKQSVIRFMSYVMNECIGLNDAIIDGKYRKSRPNEFYITERGKRRHISGVKFRDRIVQRTLCDRSLVPIVEYSLITDNAASLKDKGTGYARKRFLNHLTQSAIRWENPYIITFDYHDYFGSIDSSRAFSMIAGVYRNLARTDKEKSDVERLLSVLKLFVEDEPHLGLGNQTSQTMAIWYPNSIDHWAVQQGYYGRYMDDAYLICKNKDKARTALNEFKRRSEELGLELNIRKTHMRPVFNSDIPFLKRVYKVRCCNQQLRCEQSVHDADRERVRNDDSRQSNDCSQLKTMSASTANRRAKVRSKSDFTIDVSMSNKAFRCTWKHTRNTIRKFDGVIINYETLHSIYSNFAANVRDLTHGRGLLRRYGRMFHDECLRNGLDYDPRSH